MSSQQHPATGYTLEVTDGLLERLGITLESKETDLSDESEKFEELRAGLEEIGNEPCNEYCWCNRAKAILEQHKGA